MAVMRALSHVPEQPLPTSGWKLLATEAGRYATGLRATIQLWNHAQQGIAQLALTDPNQWADFVAEVATKAACPADGVSAALRILAVAIEGSLRQAEARASRASDAPADGEAEHRTDLGNARRLVALHGADLHYCHPWGCWLIWDGTRWARDATAEAARRAKDTVRAIYAEAARAADAARREALAKHAIRSEAEARIRAMLALAESEPEIPVKPEDFDRDPWALNCYNGTIDLRTGELRPHRREDLMTKLAPVEHDPEARSDLSEKFLARILPDPKLRAFVQRALGYSMAGVTHEEVLFFPYGPTATGKSTLLCAVAAALGDYACTADFAAFLARMPVTGGPRNDIAALAGRRFVLSLEVDEGTRLAEALLKQLTGGDVVRARYLYHESFEFVPMFALWLAANHRPLVSDDDDAIWRRILQIPFVQAIPKAEQDPQVKATLRDQARSGPAILAWLVQGCLAWQREGLGVPEAVEELTQDYRLEMDPLRDFLADRCILRSTVKARKGELWKAYQEWARATDIRPLTARQFTARLQRRFDEVRDGQARSWLGVGLSA